MSFLWPLFGFVRASASARAAALGSSKIEGAFVLESKTATWLAGGKQSRGALPVETPGFDAAVYSSRGRGYARYNEDAAFLFTDAEDRVYGAVFDQAGGLGGRIRGAASEIAAQRTFEACRSLAFARGSLDEPTVLRDAFLRAHEDLLGRGEGEVTTAVASVFSLHSVTILNSGDSAALHFDRAGVPKVRTVMHEHEAPANQGCLTHSLGLVPEGPGPDSYRWDLSTGDSVLLCTDGLLDAGLTDDEVGAMIAGSDTAEAAVNRLATCVLRLMTRLRAKPDNLSIVIVRAR